MHLVGKVVAWIVGGVVAAVGLCLLFFLVIPYMRAPDSLDRLEAQALLTEEVDRYRAKPYSELAGRVDEQTTRQVIGKSGAEYTIDVSFHWDGEPNENVRVIAGISDGGKSAYVPLTDSFIKSSGGQFVGE